LGYEIETAYKGGEALEKTQSNLPDLIILDINLPDFDGYEVCRQLRGKMRTSNIPIIFLTQRDERSDRLQGLELGADDYVTKPFDFDELKLRVQGAIRRAERERLTDPRTGLPSGRLIEEQLREVIQTADWAYLDISINEFESFSEVYGFVAADDALRFTSMLINDVLETAERKGDFLGHTGGKNFVVITSSEKSKALKNTLKGKFATDIQSQYSFTDRNNGFIQVPDKNGIVEKKPFMTFSIGIVDPAEMPIADIREITELSVIERRKDV
jgi:PleD family two-component response regulator